MKRIFIITGKTGAGKSTLCTKLESYFNYPLLSFKSMATKYANEYGFKTLREHYSSMDFSEYKIKVSEYILNIINEQMNKADTVIVDGLYIDDVVKTLEKNYNCKILYLKADDVIRYERTAKRMCSSMGQAKKEDEIRARSKSKLGINNLIESADYIIDGNKTVEEVFSVTKQYIENCN